MEKTHKKKEDKKINKILNKRYNFSLFTLIFKANVILKQYFRAQKLLISMTLLFVLPAMVMAGDVVIEAGSNNKLEVEGGKAWFHNDNNGAEDVVLKIGDGFNWDSHMVEVISADNGGRNTLKINNRRWGTNFYYTRGSPDGVQNMLYLGGADGEGHKLQLFDDDTNTVNVELRTNGDSFFNGGKVGIGTANPAAKLQISTSKNIYLGDEVCAPNFAGILIGSISGCSNYNLLGDGINTFINRPSGGQILFREGNSNQMVIDNGGNVGIGISGPAVKLDVEGESFIRQGGRIDGIALGSYSPWGYAFTQDISPVPGTDMSLQRNGGGNVGIGTGSPNAKLEVLGGVKVGDDTATCDSTKAGTIRWTGSDFEGCDGTSWVSLTQGGSSGGSGIPSTVFLTSTRYTGDLGGLSGADTICQTHANDAGFGGTYKALISSSTESAKDRIPIFYPVKRVDGVTVATSNLWQPTLENPIVVDEFGVDRSADTMSRWTRTNTKTTGDSSGTVCDCNDFTSNSGSCDEWGKPNDKTQWTGVSAGGGCSGQWPIYCIST